jgi:hypothetical protein
MAKQRRCSRRQSARGVCVAGVKAHVKGTTVGVKAHVGVCVAGAGSMSKALQRVSRLTSMAQQRARGVDLKL